jgi:hypothetical protein
MSATGEKRQKCHRHSMLHDQELVTTSAGHHNHVDFPNDIIALILSMVNGKAQLCGACPATFLDPFFLVLIACWCCRLMFIASRVNRSWKRVVDCHSSLLNSLDFSDPYLEQIDINICGIINRAGHRLREFSIWSHFGIGLIHQLGQWTINSVVSAIINATSTTLPTSIASSTTMNGPNNRLTRFVLAGVHIELFCHFFTHTFVCY